MTRDARLITPANDALTPRLLAPGADLPRFKQLPVSVKRLLHMLSYKRPAASATEAEFIEKYVIPCGARADTFGNYWFAVPEADGSASKILWSSHTDTVHKEAGKQTVSYYAGQTWTEKSNCLGADCGVGVWLMLEMISARVAGTYVFHAEEEIGGNGSAWVAAKGADLLKNFDFAIAFDRKGTNEIITEQWKGRTASDVFAESLASVLDGFGYKPSPLGSFTDTANYAEIIAECTNIGVGYYGQHTKDEWLDVDHAVRLRDALVTADWSGLVKARDPTEVPAWKGWGKRSGGAKVYAWGHTAYIQAKADADAAGEAVGAPWAEEDIARVLASHEGSGASEEAGSRGWHGKGVTCLEDFCFYEPDLAAEFIAECGFDLDDLLEWSEGRRRN